MSDSNRRRAIGRPRDREVVPQTPDSDDDNDQASEEDQDAAEDQASEGQATDDNTVLEPAVVPIEDDE